MSMNFCSSADSKFYWIMFWFCDDAASGFICSLWAYWLFLAWIMSLWICCKREEGWTSDYGLACLLSSLSAGAFASAGLLLAVWSRARWAAMASFEFSTAIWFGAFGPLTGIYWLGRSKKYKSRSLLISCVVTGLLMISYIPTSVAFCLCESF